MNRDVRELFHKLADLAPGERETFLARYLDAIGRAYPPQADGGVLLPFPRLFLVATRHSAR